MTTEALTLTTEPELQQQDWASLYRTLETDGLVPSASERTIERERARFRSMFLDLAEVKSAIAAAGVDPAFVTLYCDVLRIPEGTAWLLEGAALVIVARRVEIGAGTSVMLDFRKSHSGSLVFFADEVAGSFKVLATAKEPVRFTIDAPPAGGGLQIRYKDEQGAVSVPLTHAQGMALSPADTFRRALTTEFIFASLLYDQQPQLALSMLTFLKRWSGASNELMDTFLRSSSMLAFLTATVDAQKNGAAFVPYLSRTIYTDLVRAFVAEAQQYEADYRTLATQKEMTAQNIELAKRLAKQQMYQSQYVDQVIAQAKANYDNALAAVHAVQAKFDKTRLDIDLIKADFEKIGIPEWRTKQIVKAIIELGGAVVTFAAGIGSMFATGGATGGAAAAGAADTAKAVASAVDTGAKIAAMAKKLADVMSKLKKVAEVLGKLVTFVAKIVEVAQNIRSFDSFSKEMREFDFAGDGADLTATYEWEIYRLTSDDALADPIAQGVGYANELKLAVDTFAIYGQALAAARVAVITAGQAYANALLQKQLAEKQQKNLEEYAEALKEREAPIVEMMQQFYQRYLDTKSSMFAALLGYRASYGYWALQPSLIQPRIIDSVGTIETGLKNLTAIALDDAKAFDTFDPPPQQLPRKLFVIDDPRVLESLRKDGHATWNISLQEVGLLGLDRVRVTRVRTWLEGAKPAAGGSVTVIVATTGNYLDRLNDTHYQFVARPLRRKFQYRVSPKKGTGAQWKFDDGTFGTVEVDGALDDQVQYAYFVPTAFTQWEVRLDHTSPGTDLSGVTKITMEISGSVITELDAEELARRHSDV
ncbi:MAG TPA: hypothetical protein VHK90_00835 [Thermoanaerobaculia bacterium]|nr:hypothetical protein [Thermoanaerobaculia bacterium]